MNLIKQKNTPRMWVESKHVINIHVEDRMCYQMSLFSQWDVDEWGEEDHLLYYHNAHAAFHRHYWMIL